MIIFTFMLNCIGWIVCLGFCVYAIYHKKYIFAFLFGVAGCFEAALVLMGWRLIHAL